MKQHTIQVRLVTKYTLNRILAEHWGVRREEKDLYHLLVRETLKKSDIKIQNFPVIVQYHFHTSGKQLDWTNLAGMTKLIEDALVSANLFPDDSPKYIRAGTMLSDQIKNDKQAGTKQHVDITIFEPEEGEILTVEARP